jgi:NAD(P)-dependent dehydrogenase (short-subunit alcohol dehydrogenase family)
MEGLNRSARSLGRLRGKSAVVTGSAKGIGHATAEVFAREGARLVITDVDEDGLAGQKEQSTYGPAKFVASGITNHLAVEWADRGIRVNAVAPGLIRPVSGPQAGHISRDS